MKNTSCVLDRYAASGTQYNNADVWENDPDEDANQIVSFEETIFPNTVKFIKNLPIFILNHSTTYISVRCLLLEFHLLMLQSHLNVSQ